MFLIRGGVLLVSLLISASVLAGETPKVQVWPVDSLTKVFPNDGSAASSPAPEFWAARGQHLSIQFAVRSPQVVKGMTAAVSLKNAKGEPCECATVRRVGYVVVGSH